MTTDGWIDRRRLEVALRDLARQHGLNGSAYASVPSIGTDRQQDELVALWLELPADIRRRHREAGWRMLRNLVLSSDTDLAPAPAPAPPPASAAPKADEAPKAVTVRINAIDRANHEAVRHRIKQRKRT